MTQQRGFAGMSKERRTEIARLGGANVPGEARSFSKDRELAARAGARGGKLVKPEDRSFSVNRKLAAEAGRKGGRKSGRGRTPKPTPETQQ